MDAETWRHRALSARDEILQAIWRLQTEDGETTLHALQEWLTDNHWDAPQIEDMPPIDITGGLSSEEYVRRMRDDA